MRESWNNLPLIGNSVDYIMNILKNLEHTEWTLIYLKITVIASRKKNNVKTETVLELRLIHWLHI